MTEWPQLDDIHRAIRAHDGAASAPDIARHLGKAETGIRRVIRAAVPRGRPVVNAPTEADVLTTLGFQLVARADEARPAQRKDLLVAALLVLTAAGHGHPDTATELDALMRGGDARGNQTDQ